MSDLVSALGALAASGQTITYGALARDLGWRMAELTSALESLMEQDARAGRPLRASLCEARLSGGLPARGFFEKASELGFDVSDPAAFAAAHRAASFAVARPVAAGSQNRQD
ncbi:hypothetical protein [Pseudotabrizicola algicola]|uniref:Uncharacterized protein n=1 Tax=Pseudotabrizicola algicola TaxID=2709381 RepID=A0A6B3RM86_9RHOB|nr:hypothetical protein [Pseudotabrizicola algicola]NEX45375.1 hypothetical protein [Pseudotabrizicola algicola]